MLISRKIFHQNSCGIWENLNDIEEAKNFIKSLRTSDLWHMELTGADIVRDEFGKLINSSFKTWIPPEKFAIYDYFGAFSDTHHGDVVVSPIAGHPQLSLFPYYHPTKTHFDRNKYKFSERFEFLIPTRIINVSMGDVGTQTDLIHSVSEFSKEKRLVFVAAGNNKLDLQNDGAQGPIARKLADEDLVIFVGGYTKSGLLVKDFTFSESIQVYAPGQNVMVADREKIGLLDGTSFSSPQVAAAIAAFEIKTKLEMTPEEAIHLLRETSFKHLSNYNSPKAGGLLNTYKIYAVGERLIERCQKDFGCMRKALEDKNIYDFSNQILSDDTAKVLTDFLVTEKGSCENVKIAFRQLRRTFLLNPSEKKSATLLRDIHLRFRLSEIADFFDHIHQASFANNEKELIATMVEKENLWEEYFLLPPFPLQSKLLLEMLKKDSALFYRRLNLAAPRILPEVIREFQKILKDSSSEQKNIR